MQSIITLAKLINVSSLHSYISVYVMSEPEISLSTFPTFNTVLLTIVIMLYLSSPDFSYVTAVLCPLTNIPLNWEPLLLL